jgi:hypothetical protein
VTEPTTEVVITEFEAAVIRVCRENDLLQTGRVQPGLSLPQIAYRLPARLLVLHREAAPVLARLGRRGLLYVARRRRDDGGRACRRYRATGAGADALAAYERSQPGAQT